MSESTRAHRSDDTLIAEALIHLQYLRKGLDDLNAKVGVQNGRIGISETRIAHLMESQDQTAKNVAAKIEERARAVDRNLKLLAAFVAFVGTVVTLAVKFL